MVQKSSQLNSEGNAALSIAEGLSPLHTRIFRVLIDGRKLTHGGIGVYTQNLILGLLESKRAVVTVIGDSNDAEEFPFADDVNWIHETAKPYSLDEFFLLPGRIDFSRYDLFHEPHYTLPFRIPIPSVVTIHDLIHITHPERFYYPAIAKRLVNSALSRASEIVLVSEATKESLVSLLPASSSKAKLHVVRNSFPDLNFQSFRGYNSERFSYVLLVASNNKPHKAIQDGIKAFEAARKFFGEDIPELVVIGHGSEELNTKELPNFVNVRGSVSKSELASWYRDARALLVPSLAEGFCLPALEAKALGIPVIARPVKALTELLGQNDFIAQDFSLSSLTAQLVKALSTKELKRELPDKEFFSRYSRAKTTEGILSVYEKALS